MSVQEVAQELGVHPVTVRKWVKEGRLACEPLVPYKRRQPLTIIRASVERLKRGEA